MRLSHARAVALMVLVTLMWSIAGVVSRHFEAARGFEVTFWRSAFNALALVLLLGVMRGPATLWATLKNGGPSLWVSGLCWSIMFTAFMVALSLTTVANVLVTMALAPLLTAVAARVFIGHRIARRTAVAIVVAVCGIGWMYGNQLAQGINFTGTLVALCVAISGAANWTVTQHAHAKGHDVDLIPAVLIGAVLSSLIMLPLALPFQASAHDLGLLFGLGLIQLAIPSSLAVVCARSLKAPEVALLGLLEVIFGILLAWVGAGEVPGRDVLVGGGLVVGALAANELLGWRQRNA